jgi:PPP family 3-phenylpropionic acid transporter
MGKISILDTEMNPNSGRENLGPRFGLSYFLFFAIYGIASPYLPILLRGIGYSPGRVGLFLGIFELIGIGGPIFLAKRADARGKYNPYLLGSGFLILAGLLFLVAWKSPIATIISLGLISLGLKTPISVLDAALIKTIERGETSKKKLPSYGALRSLGSLGFVFVTLSVQFIPGFDTSPAWVMALAMAALTLAYMLGLSLLPEAGTKPEGRNRKRLDLSWIDHSFILCILIIALSRLSMSAYTSFFSLYLVEYLNWHTVGAMSALAAVVEIPMLMLSRRAMRKYSPIDLIQLSSVAVILRLLAYALFPTKGGVILGQVLHSVSYGLFHPAAVTLISLKTPPSERATGISILVGIGMGLPVFLGSTIGGLVIEAVGYRWLFAIFSLFSMGSIALYRTKGGYLRNLR